MSKVCVMIATPLRHYRGIEDLPKQIGRTLRELHDHPAFAFEFAAAVGGLCRARNSLVHEFLKSSCQWLLWWDDDLMAGPAEVLRILSHRQPSVAGLYCKRGKRPAWAATFMPMAELQPQADGLLQVVEAAGGWKLTHRKVYEEVARLLPDIGYQDHDTGEWIFGFYQQPVMEKRLYPEDYFFDYLCRCVKIGILVDTRLRLPHRNPDGTQYPGALGWPAIPGVDEADRPLPSPESSAISSPDSDLASAGAEPARHTD